MRFWDSSALVPIIVNEDTSEEIAHLLAEDSDIALWWGSKVECMSSLARRWREGSLDRVFLERSRHRFDLLFDDAFEVSPTEEVRSLALDLSFEVTLKAADTLQLAAAMVWRGDDIPGMEFVCLDRQLRGAASERGFDVLPEGETA